MSEEKQISETPAKADDKTLSPDVPATDPAPTTSDIPASEAADTPSMDKPPEDVHFDDDGDDVFYAEPDEKKDEPAAEAAAESTEPPSLYAQLSELAERLTANPSPLFHKDEVRVPREETLELIDTLLAFCPQEGGPMADDALMDRLSSDGHEGDVAFQPLLRVKSRARTIINDATWQADRIVDDAKFLAAKLLQETEEKINAELNEAEENVAKLKDISKEESSKRLNEAREELTVSRQQAVEILNRYMDKAEDDYQGYWERAEKTLLVSLQKSDAALAKAGEIYERELAVIREDIETINGILEELKMYRPR